MANQDKPTFFTRKRDWSLEKDKILAEYLKAYLPVVYSAVKKPILVVDAFAGPGVFDDGTHGSPMIVCHCAEKAIGTGVRVDIICIEKDLDCFKALRENLQSFHFAEARHGAFLDFTGEVAELAHDRTLFLYVDPYAIEGLEWVALDDILKHLRDSRSSIELLLNFNARALVRRGLALLHMQSPALESHDEFGDADDVGGEAARIERLNRSVGGDWWQRTLKERPTNFSEQVIGVTKAFEQQLRTRFNEVCSVPIKGKPSDMIPKYYMVFGSRSQKALEIMNNAMVQARTEFSIQTDLIAPQELRDLILSSASRPAKRGAVVQDVIRQAPCMFTTSEIRRVVGSLLHEGRLASASGKERINDQEEIWAS